ncbi:Fic family protein [Candidatus Saccharibacteria bacterium]|nr:Fic family protein [Candidatus Saccharibacteria bacterium]
MSYKPKFVITDKIKDLLQDIGRINNVIAASRILPAVEASVRYRASVEAAHSSTSIEGNPLSMNEVRAVFASDKTLTKEEYAELEVKNYKAALDFIERRRYGASEITLDDVLELHGIIMTGLTTKNRTGQLRFNPVYIENQKTHEMIYEGAPVDDVKAEMLDLLTYTTDNQYIMHPVILAAIIHLHFVAIHPFADGNGRTARALTMLFLAINQYDDNGALVLDSYYATDRAAYYATLQNVNGKNYATSVKADITPWLEYFVEGYVTSLRVLDAEIRLLNMSLMTGEPAGLSREDQDLLSYAAKFGAICISDAEKLLPELNRRSIQRRLKQLVDDGYLELVGETHDARYVLKRRG